MFCKLTFLVKLVIFCQIAWITAQICVPDPVEEIELSTNSILSWSASQNCPSTQYTVIIETGGIIEYEYTVNSLSLNLTFLSFCRSYKFTVTPIADHILGLETYLESSISLPANVTIAVQNFTGAQIDDDVLLQWHVDDAYKYCIGYYQLLIWDEDSADPESLYVGQNGYFLEHVANCMKYQFEITTFYNSTNGTTGVFNYTVPAAPNNPTLLEVEHDTLTINTTWRLESFNLNRCNVTKLIVNGTHFNATYPIVDSPARPDVRVSIGGLHANSMYYFNVSTNNTLGISQAYQMAVQTLPLDPSYD